jgi:hypothetical protein
MVTDDDVSLGGGDEVNGGKIWVRNGGKSFPPNK